jgi:hypothetical protein
VAHVGFNDEFEKTHKIPRLLALASAIAFFTSPTRCTVRGISSAEIGKTSPVSPAITKIEVFITTILSSHSVDASTFLGRAGSGRSRSKAVSIAGGPPIINADDAIG